MKVRDTEINVCLFFTDFVITKGLQLRRNRLEK